MDSPPPVKPPRGVKQVKETSGLLMSMIRALSTSETNEQRDREKAKLETEYKRSDKKLDELVSNHDKDLTQVMQVFGTISQQVTDSRQKIHKVKEDLQACKTLLHCRRDELKKLWLEGLEYKHMLQLLEEIEKINEVPHKLSNYLNGKHYLHATQLLVDAVTMGKESLEGVEGLKELSLELETKKQQIHKQMLAELRQHLYVRTAQNALALRRQGSGRAEPGAAAGGQGNFQRQVEFRSSARQRAAKKNMLENVPKFQGSKTEFNVEENLDKNPEEDSAHFMAILVKCLALLQKLPIAVETIKSEMQTELMTIVQRTTRHVNDFGAMQNAANDNNAAKPFPLLELVQILFDQFKHVAHAHAILLQYLGVASNVHKADVKLYDMNEFWGKVQSVFQALLTDYLDIQNLISDTNLDEAFSNTSDLSQYFSRRKPPNKKKSMFKFDGSSSALTLNNHLRDSNLGDLMQQSKVLVCTPNQNNITHIFIPLKYFIDEIETKLKLQHGGFCKLNQFLSQYITDVFLKRRQLELTTQIDVAVRASDAWKATALPDATRDCKPILNSTLTVERCVQEWRSLLHSLPLYGEDVVKSVCVALREYRDTCQAAYRGIVQPHPEDRRICSAAWLKDDDISRFLKSLPNWLNLKTQQEFQARNIRRRTIHTTQSTEEESPEDVRLRNRREAEILASTLGEGGVRAEEILSDMTLLKGLAQLQESMEWFSVRMLQFASELRQDPGAEAPADGPPMPALSAGVLQTLTSIGQDFDELADTCLLLLHLEVRVQCFHYLLAQSEYNKETHEPDPKVLELNRVMANVDEAMTSSLHARKCKYIFEGLGHLIAKILISSSQYMQKIDESGIQRMCRNVFALQQTLTHITMTREVALDHARHYFEQFFLTPEEILNGIVEKGPEFSELEYMNAFQLINRSRKGDQRSVDAYLERLSDILGEVGVIV